MQKGNRKGEEQRKKGGRGNGKGKKGLEGKRGKRNLTKQFQKSQGGP